MKRKLVATLLATTMMVSALIGCGNQTSSTPTETEENGTQAATESTSEVVEEDVTIKVLLCMKAGHTIPENIHDIELISKLDEEIGVTTEWEIVMADNWATQWNLIMASGEYPDLIISRNGKVDVEEYGVDQKILRPLDDLITDHLPNYTDRIAMESYDPTVALRASDGQTYTIGYMSAENTSVWSLYYINQAWMDALKIETPTTVDALTDVLRAFKTKDPNGNGKADEIPLTFQMDTSGTSTNGIGWMLPLFGIPFGGANSWLFVDNNKEIQFIPTHEGFRASMEWLNTCYKEGLLDVEALSQDGAAITRKLEDDLVGFTTAWRVVNGTTFGETAGKSLALYTPGEGSMMYHNLELASPRVYLTSTNEHPEKTMEWLNAYLDTENMFTGMYGRQNQNQDATYSGWYYNENGLIATCPAPKDLTVKDWLTGNGLFFAPSVYKAETMVTNATAQERTDASDVYEAAGILQKYSNDYLKTVPLQPAESERKTLIEADMTTAVKEYMAKAIMEGVTDANWNEFVGVMENIGAKEYVNMHQAALDTLNLK